MVEVNAVEVRDVEVLFLLRPGEVTADLFPLGRDRPAEGSLSCFSLVLDLEEKCLAPHFEEQVCFNSLGGIEPDTIVQVTDSKEGRATKSLLTGDREGEESLAELEPNEGKVLGPSDVTTS